MRQRQGSAEREDERIETFLPFCFCLIKMGSQVAQAGFQLSLQQRMILNS